MKTQLTALALSALTLSFSSLAQAETLNIGGKNFTEQLILASMTSQYLEEKGYDVDERSGMGTSVLRQAQENGQIDLYWEYTGTSLISYNKVEEKLSPRQPMIASSSWMLRKGWYGSILPTRTTHMRWLCARTTLNHWASTASPNWPG